MIRQVAMNGYGTCVCLRRRGGGGLFFFLCFEGPESFILTLSGDEFLLKWNSIGWVAEHFEDPKSASQCGVAIERCVMNGTKGTVTVIDLCNDEQLMALNHFGQFDWGPMVSEVFNGSIMEVARVRTRTKMRRRAPKGQDRWEEAMLHS